MTHKTQPVRGTQDILDPQSSLHRHIESTALKTAQLFGFEEIITPIMEFSEVFHRSLGETSDVVSKETYTFNDRGGDSITLRPEGTAGVVRALISNGLAQNLPLRFFYSGPMFRHERPQKGRYRQFNQIGVEYLGGENISSDVECLLMADCLLKNLKITSYELQINTLGDPISRAQHREKLVQFLSKYKNELSEFSKIRLEKNPLRIFDSKDPNDQKLLASAPKLTDCLNTESKKIFEGIQSRLVDHKIAFSVSDHLVRGFDYYSHLVFEFVTQDLGSQSAILAGGRYDKLVGEMGGPDVAGIGWAAGTERLSMLMPQTEFKKTFLPFIAADEVSIPLVQKFCQEFRKSLMCKLLDPNLTLADLNRLNQYSCLLLPFQGVGKSLKKAWIHLASSPPADFYNPLLSIQHPNILHSVYPSSLRFRSDRKELNIGKHPWYHIWPSHNSFGSACFSDCHYRPN
jgi:histidyl-tRNA synthetase